VTGVLRTAQRLAHALDARRPVRGLVPALHRAAVSNAHDALHELHRSVLERQALQRAAERHVVPMARRETDELLGRGCIGRLAYVARQGTPDIVPVNYAWADGAVWIRSGPGPKLQAAERGDTMAFEVDEVDVVGRVGASAVVVGRAEVVDPQAVVVPVDVWAEGPRRHCIRIVATRVEGRRLA